MAFKANRNSQQKISFALNSAKDARALFRVLLSCLLLISLSAPIIATYTALKVQQRVVRKSVKRKMMAGIPKEKLELLKFLKSELNTQVRWKHSKEFEYKGEWYDIVYTEEKGDSIFYHCWWDHEETELNRKVKALAWEQFRQSSTHKEIQEKFQNFMQLLYCQDLSTVGLYELFFIKIPIMEQDEYLYKVMLCARFRHAPFAPPPEYL